MEFFYVHIYTLNGQVDASAHHTEAPSKGIEVVCNGHTVRGPGRKPGASLYTRKRLSPHNGKPVRW